MLGPSSGGPAARVFAAARRFATARPVGTCWLLLGLVTTLPYLLAALAPPAGRTFTGAFHWIDDLYNHVSYVQQAEDGRLLFRNKLRLEEHSGALVNLAWWALGLLSRICGRRPFLAYRLFALAVLFFFLRAADRWLQRAGLVPARRLPALLLVATGGGLGGLLFELTPRPAFRCADLSIGLFPFLEILANPSWLAGTWLLLQTLMALDDASSWRGGLRAAGLATVLGLVRPYDLVLAGLVHGLGVSSSDPPREWGRRLLPLLGLGPVALYNYWVLYAIPTFATFYGGIYGMPPPSDFLWALAPAGLLALSALRPRPGDQAAKRRLAQPLAWALLSFLVILWRPVSFSQQFIIGAGLPLLLLAALGLSRARPWALPVATVLMCSTAVVALLVVFRPDPNWFVPAERRQAALAMRPHCRPGDLAFSPDDIGLFTIALTACHAFVSHPLAPAHTERQALVRSFYGPMPPGERRALLVRLKVALLALPGDAGPSAGGWLGEEAPFRQIARVGAPPGTISVYLRTHTP